MEINYATTCGNYVKLRVHSEIANQMHDTELCEGEKKTTIPVRLAGLKNEDEEADEERWRSLCRPRLGEFPTVSSCLISASLGWSGGSSTSLRSRDIRRRSSF